MLSIETLRRIDPVNTANMTDQEIENIRGSFYGLSQLIFNDSQESKISSKSPVRSVVKLLDNSKI